MSSLLKLSPRLSWLAGENLRPYVLARHECRVKNPGSKFSLDWFVHEPFFMDPLLMNDVYFANALLSMENRAFGKSDMAMPRWVFYDCAIMPGFISGFAHKTETLPGHLRKILGEENLQGEWTPISMFIIIPTMIENEWVAHNLSSINAMIPKEDRYYGLGFLSKAFGLSYANIDICCGVTQWKSPAMKLHSYYGFFEILTSYTPAHTYPRSLTYRLNVNPGEWVRFFTKEESPAFFDKFEQTGFLIDSKDDKTIIQLQKMIESGQGPFYLDSAEIRAKKPGAALNVFTLKGQAPKPIKLPTEEL